MCVKHLLVTALALAWLSAVPAEIGLAGEIDLKIGHGGADTEHAPTTAPAATQPADKATIDKLIEQLGDSSFQARKEAQAALQAIGEPAEGALKAAVQSQDPEVKQRATTVLKNFADRRFKAASDHVKKSLLWVADIAGGASGTPVIADGLAVVTTGEGALYAVDIKSGKKVWLQKDFDKAMMLNQPMIAKGQVILSAVPPQENGAMPQPGAAGSQMVYAVDLKTGKINWRFNVPKPETQPAEQPAQGNVVRAVGFFGTTTNTNEQPGVTDKAVFVRDADNKLHTLDLQGGKSLSNVAVDAIGNRPVANDSMLFVPLVSGEIQALDLATGKQVWKEAAGPEGAQVPCSQLTMIGGLLCCRTLQGLAALDPKTGKRAWRCELTSGSAASFRNVTVINGRMVASGSQSVGAMVVQGGLIYALDGPELVAVEAKTGVQQRRYAIKLPGQGDPSGGPNIGSGGAAAEAQVRIAIAQAQAGAIRYGGGTMPSSLAVADKTAYLGTGDSIIAMDLDSGFVVWQLRLSGNMLGSPLVIDGVLYVGTWQASGIYRGQDAKSIDAPQTGLQAVKVK